VAKSAKCSSLCSNSSSFQYWIVLDSVVVSSVAVAFSFSHFAHQGGLVLKGRKPRFSSSVITVRFYSSILEACCSMPLLHASLFRSSVASHDLSFFFFSFLGAALCRRLPLSCPDGTPLLALVSFVDGSSAVIVGRPRWLLEAADAFTPRVVIAWIIYRYAFTLSFFFFFILGITSCHVVGRPSCLDGAHVYLVHIVVVVGVRSAIFVISLRRLLGGVLLFLALLPSLEPFLLMLSLFSLCFVPSFQLWGSCISAVWFRLVLLLSHHMHRRCSPLWRPK
jgi:hypothetical protein